MDIKYDDEYRTLAVEDSVSLPLDREQRLSLYLQKWVDAGTIHQCVAQDTIDIWKRLLALSNYRLPVPDAADGNKSEVMLIWSKNTHYLEIEVSPADECFVFYKDDLTLAHYFYEGKADSLPYAEMPEIIKHFV